MTMIATLDQCQQLLMQPPCIIPPVPLQLYLGFPFLRTALCCSPMLRDEQLLTTLAEEVASYTAANGLMMIKEGVTLPLPCTLLPTPWPREAYVQVQALATMFNSVYHRVSQDHEFLTRCLAETAQADPFIARLMRIATIVHESSANKQRLHLCINRSDYMLHASTQGSFIPQQVEFNTISAGLACLSSKVSEMHRYLVTRHSPQWANSMNLPVNNALHGVVEAMATAFQLYRKQSNTAADMAIVMVVQRPEWNIVDQQLIAFELWKRYEIPLIRKTLAEINQGCMDSRGQLVIDGRVIALTYFRAGYTPRDYSTEAEWEALLKIESSITIKCPSVAYHLAGCKRIQQVLSSTEVLQQFASTDELTAIQLCVTELHGLSVGAEQTHSIVAAALADPQSFVLKPQREGGGNNLWNDELVHELKTASAEKLATYILMRQIHAPASNTAGLRQGQLHKFRGVSELGIFGVFVSEGETVHLNQAAGYLLRTKSAEKHEGGISAGSGFLDSIVLT